MSIWTSMSAPFSFGDVPDPVEPERPLIVDQLCIDIQGSLFDEEMGVLDRFDQLGAASRSS